jgi:hypothetical protein
MAYRHVMNFALPDGLPPGRIEPRGSTRAWISNDLPQDIERLWGLLLGQQATSGLFPLLCWPDSPTRDQDLAEVDAISLESVLPADFAEYRRQRLPYWSDPTPAEVPEGVEPWPHDPGPPFESWPGLAPTMPATADSSSPAQVAAHTVAHLVETGWHELEQCRLALLPARRSADLPALLEWSGEAPIPLLCALLRSWEERFGAQVVAVCGSSLYVSVARPPQDTHDAELLALEHVLSTADSIVDDPPTPFPEYAAGLGDQSYWRFWWD